MQLHATTATKTTEGVERGLVYADTGHDVQVVSIVASGDAAYCFFDNDNSESDKGNDSMGIQCSKSAFQQATTTTTTTASTTTTTAAETTTTTIK